MRKQQHESDSHFALFRTSFWIPDIPWTHHNDALTWAGLDVQSRPQPLPSQNMAASPELCVFITCVRACRVETGLCPNNHDDVVNIRWSLTGATYPIMQRFASAAGWEWVKVCFSRWIARSQPSDDGRETNSWVVEQYNSQEASLFHFYFITHFKTRRFKWLPNFI